MNNHSLVEMAHLKLTKTVFSVNPGFLAPEERISIGVSLKNNGEFINDGFRANFTQQFKTGDPEDTPFALEVEFTALFVLDPAPLPLEWPYYVRKVFPRIVFPYLREYVAETTRRGGFVPLVLNQSLFEDDPVDERRFTPDEPKWIH